MGAPVQHVGVPSNPLHATRLGTDGPALGQTGPPRDRRARLGTPVQRLETTRNLGSSAYGIAYRRP
eukprot:CAMPEP_0180148374 /NCGR_PEP_ID=MMETSP0986-20121125/19940_1 /TAXON_ID=697907 /ORGANISM="non described non described, Strain CCMP2293" /LENGTH=65 /DNA_ID=CAMNT_0022094355 /DNA_START=42 /DNA_END=239 /DNA_ORIENTATION=-